MTNGALEKRKGQRTCICCGKQEGKGQLHRFVRTAEGQVAFDPTGRAAGRGAYVCSKECLMKACKNRRLERALRISIAPESYDQLTEEFFSSPSGGDGEDGGVINA